MTMLCATKAVPGDADWSVTEQNVPKQQLVARNLGAQTREIPLRISALLTMERLLSENYGSSYGLFGVFLFS